MGKCAVCGRGRKCVGVTDCVGVAVRVCAKCRRRYFPTRQERVDDDSAAERTAERACELTAENGLCGFEF